MKKQWCILTGILLVIFLACSEDKKKDHPGAEKDAQVQESTSFGDKLGTVVFPVSCTKEVIPHMERGLALLHHMTYEGAEAAFRTASEADPDCALSYWGQAMSYIHPLWSDPPTEAEFDRGLELVAMAKTRGEKTAWETAYILALQAYFEPGRNRNESENLAGFEKGWKQAHEATPGDIEAASFYALAHLGTADPADKTYSKQKNAGAMLERVLEKAADHPGGHHYTIHAYDYPPLAEKALKVARNYGNIAPDVPHALHMPTHIFTRLGLWDESIAWNKRSAKAALNYPAGDAVSLHYLHALDYLAYAYLQKREDDKAQAVADSLRSLEGPFQVEVATPYTFAALPARLYLERQKWKGAALLRPRIPEVYPWDKFPAVEAITWFAKAIGAARSGDINTASAAIDTLDVLEAEAQKSSVYWAEQVTIQQLSARAWLAYAKGQKQDALDTMQKAVAMEASTEKHPVTPGEVLPAYELLGNMLLEMRRPDEALRAYESSLQRSPNRLNSLYGAGRSAELAGNLDKAVLHYNRLVKLTDNANDNIDKLKQARAFVKAHR